MAMGGGCWLSMQRPRPDPGFAVRYEVPEASVPPPPANVFAVGVAGCAAQRAGEGSELQSATTIVNKNLAADEQGFHGSLYLELFYLDNSKHFEHTFDPN